MRYEDGLHSFVDFGEGSALRHGIHLLFGTAGSTAGGQYEEIERVGRWNLFIADGFTAYGGRIFFVDFVRQE